MKCIIAGGRDYHFLPEDVRRLDRIKDEMPITEVVSGGARGADRHGEWWASTNQIPVTLFPANWAKHGREAGPIRNQKMADYADAVILFPGGAGTRSMHRLAAKEGLKIIDFMKQPD